MAFQNRVLLFTVMIASILLACPSLYAAGPAASTTQQAEAFVTMPAPGEKVLIGNDRYMIYGFVHKPKMGPVVMKVQVFDKNGAKDSTLTISADSGMPSMPSMGVAHDTFKLSRKGDYLMPVNITMPGDWEVKITVSKDGTILYRGSYCFDV